MKHEKQEQLRRVSRFPICVFEKREEMPSPAAEILVGKLFLRYPVRR